MKERIENLELEILTPMYIGGNKKSKLKKYRTKQYQKSLNDNRAYNFYLTREQTRYKQINYIRTPYKVVQKVGSFSCDYNFIRNRNEQLKAINYECTLKEYNSKNQKI